VTCGSKRSLDKPVATNEKFCELNRTFKERTLMGSYLTKEGQQGTAKHAASGSTARTIPWEVVRARLYARLGVLVK